MKKKGLLFLTAILISLCPIAAIAQSDNEFLTLRVNSSSSLMGEWKAVSYSDAVGRQKTEFVYRDRSEGLLKISRERSRRHACRYGSPGRREPESLPRQGSSALPASLSAAAGLDGHAALFLQHESGRADLQAHTIFLQDGNSSGFCALPASAARSIQTAT